MIYTYAVVAIVAALGSGIGVWHIQNWRHDSAELERRSEEQRLLNKRVVGVDKAAEGHEVGKERIRTVFRNIETEVERVVEKPIYRNVCIDDDGMRQLQSAIAAIANAASQPAPAVSSPASSPRWNWRRNP